MIPEDRLQEILASKDQEAALAFCTELPALDPDQLYEECPDCEGDCDGCLTCFDEGLVPHACSEDG